MKWHKKKIKSVWVLGSTSEVARSICRELAIRGCMQFYLIARNSLENEKFANELTQSYGVVVNCQQTDLMPEANVKNKYIYEVGDFDLYLVTAGSLGDAELARVDAEEALRITNANYTGLNDNELGLLFECGNVGFKDTISFTKVSIKKSLYDQE